MIEDNPEHVWVRVDPVIETLLGLEPGGAHGKPGGGTLSYEVGPGRH